MLHFLLTSAFVSSVLCQIKFSGVASPRSTNTSSSTITEFAFSQNSTNLAIPRSDVVRFPGYSTAAPSSTAHPSLIPTTPTNIRLFALNKWGHIECTERTDCPPDFVDTEKKNVIKYICAKPISQIIADREGAGISGESFAAPPENEDPANTCAEDLTGYYCADPTRPGCEVCPGFRGQASSLAGPVPGYCWPKSVFRGNLPNYLTGTVGQTFSSLEDILPCTSDIDCRLPRKATVQVQRRQVLQGGWSWTWGQSACLPEAVRLDLSIWLTVSLLLPLPILPF